MQHTDAYQFLQQQFASQEPIKGREEESNVRN